MATARPVTPEESRGSVRKSLFSSFELCILASKALSSNPSTRKKKTTKIKTLHLLSFLP
jgi:hypothetical protein